MPPSPSVLRALARAGFGEPGLGLGLDRLGEPSRPSVVLDAAAFAGLSPAELTEVAEILADADVVVLAAVRTAPLPVELLAGVDVVFATAHCASAASVTVPDPRRAADELAVRIATMSRASIAYAWLLRHSQHVSVAEAVVAESTAYSMLLGGPDFAAWLAARKPARPVGSATRLRLVRDGNELRITLTRADRRNAVDAAMRDALIEAFSLAVWDPELQVSVDAEGPSFSAGGDLDEFGSATDTARAHLVRVSASAGRAIDRVRDRVTFHVHGDCIGAGMELPAFAGRVVAHPETRFRLPEIAMGLIPGAGGTVSLPRRIGRHRAAYLGLSGIVLDAPTALEWKLVDAIV